MTTPRFFCNQPITVGEFLRLPDALAHHVRVLRLEQGVDITLFNGQGGQFEARLVLDGKALEGKTAYAHVLKHSAREAELRGRITLVQGLASGDKMDWIIEKAVEMGVAQVQPIAARRSVLRLSGGGQEKRLEKRLQHWQRIAQAASEQCGRNRLMPIATVLTLEKYLRERQNEPAALLLCCDPDAPENLHDLLPADYDHIILLVGAEGGWSQQELEVAQTCGARRVRFGSRVLRTETAGIALVSAITALNKWD